MNRAIRWIWTHGIVSTFLSGLFAILPIVLTVAVVSWVVGLLKDWLGPDSWAGGQFKSLGEYFGAGAGTAWVVGWVLVLAGIWVLGLLMKGMAKNRVEKTIDLVVARIPIVKSVYSTVTQVVGMVKKTEASELQSMSAVFCSFGQDSGAGVLALLTSPEVYRFNGRDYKIVYVPTSPVPMTGGIVFVPAETVTKVDMSAEAVMRIYFSLGILAPQVVPPQHLTLKPASD